MTLTDRILRTLGSAAVPVPTPDLIAAVAAGLSHARGRVHATLGKLLAGGVVVRGHQFRRTHDTNPHRWYRHKGRRVAVWSLANA